jgi:HSP20 family protein
MNKLAFSKTNVPEAFQSMFRQMAKPWIGGDDWVQSMFKPGVHWMDPAFTRAFDTMTRSFSDSMRLGNGWMEPQDMNLEVVEKNGGYKVRADLPGMKKEDIHVSVDGNAVTIEAQTQGSSESKGGKVLFNERHYGAISRTFTLDHEVDESKATGQYTDGVLTLEIPKKPGAPKTEAKAIAIK